MLNRAKYAVQWIYAGITSVQMHIDLLCNCCNFIKGVIEPHKGQRIGDCFQTMWVLCFPNSPAIVPPTFHSTISSYFPLSCVIFPNKYFRKPMFSNKTQDSAEKAEKISGCTGWAAAREPQNGFHSLDFARPSSPPTIHCHWSWHMVDEKSPAFQIHTLEAWGPAGAPARLPQFDWFVSRWLAVRPNRRPVKIPTAVVFISTAGHCPPIHFQPPGTISNSLPRAPTPLFVEIANNRAPRNRGTWDKSGCCGEVLWRNFVKYFTGRRLQRLRKKVNDSKQGFHQR